MAYTQGVANSLAELITAVQAACVASGWTLRGDVLHTDRSHVQLRQVGTTVTLLGGTGIDSSGNLVGQAPATVRIGTAGILALVFPCTYQIAVHGYPDEVFVHVNYDVDKWQWLAFGCSEFAAAGTGCWVAATMQQNNPNSIGVAPTLGYSGSGRCSTALFYSGAGAGAHSNCFMHSDIDGAGWMSIAPATSVTGVANLSYALAGLIDRQPSAMNGGTVLLPAQVWQVRVGWTKSLAADFRHCRILRIDNYLPGQVIPYGSERWKVFPFFRKDASQRDGGDNVGHTGTMGMAVRYDGP